MDDIRCSITLADNDTVVSFYSKYEGITHGFVVFKTRAGHSYMCHLVGLRDVLCIEMERTDYRPGKNVEFHLTKELSLSGLKQHLINIKRSFGTYILGSNDCRHLAHLIHNDIHSYCEIVDMPPPYETAVNHLLIEEDPMMKKLKSN